MRLLRIIALILVTTTHLSFTTNVFLEEDFYLLHTTYDTLIYEKAIHEITGSIERARKRKIFAEARNANIVFKDLEKRVQALQKGGP